MPLLDKRYFLHVFRHVYTHLVEAKSTTLLRNNCYQVYIILPTRLYIFLYTEFEPATTPTTFKRLHAPLHQSDLPMRF